MAIWSPNKLQGLSFKIDQQSESSSASYGCQVTCPFIKHRAVIIIVIGQDRTCHPGGHYYSLYPVAILAHLPLDKMAATLADDIFKCIFLNENGRIAIQISIKFATRGPIDNKPALVQVMAWCRTGEKPLPEAMMT